MTTYSSLKKTGIYKEVCNIKFKRNKLVQSTYSRLSRSLAEIDGCAKCSENTVFWGEEFCCSQNQGKAKSLKKNTLFRAESQSYST